MSSLSRRHRLMKSEGGLCGERFVEGLSLNRAIERERERSFEIVFEKKYLINFSSFL